jgi:hypothetical protein
MDVGVWVRSLGLDRRRLLAAIAALTDATPPANRPSTRLKSESSEAPQVWAVRCPTTVMFCDPPTSLFLLRVKHRSPSNALVLDIGIQTRFSSVRAKASARSSGMRPITRWLRPPRDQEASERSTRRSERIGASGA